MSIQWTAPSPGALDDNEWPDRIQAKAVDLQRGEIRFHGYALLGDLAAQYAYSDTIYLAITGELPSDDASWRFALVMASFAAVGPHQASTHVGVLSRISGGSMPSAIAACAVAAADYSRQLLQENAPFVDWLAHRTGAIPTARPDLDDQAAQTLLREIEARTSASVVGSGMSHDEMRLALLYEAGVTTSDQLGAALTLALTVGAVAESILASPSDLSKYPVRLPPFQYVENGASRDK